MLQVLRMGLGLGVRLGLGLRVGVRNLHMMCGIR